MVRRSVPCVALMVALASGCSTESGGSNAPSGTTGGADATGPDGAAAVPDGATPDTAPPMDAVGDGTSSGGDGAVAPDVLDRAALLAEQGRVICQRGFECAPALLEPSYGGTLEACIAREAPSLAPIADLPGVTVTPEQLRACGDSLGAASCSVFRRSVFGNAPTPECDLRGTQPAGAPCAHYAQCQSGICLKAAGETCGECRDPVPAGGACQEWLVCGPGSGCAGGVCAPLVEAGGACGDKLPCHDDLACLNDVCSAALTAGSPCTSVLGQCDKYGGVACDPTTSLCVQAGIAQVGEACGVTDHGLFLCHDADCLPSLLFGTCTAKAADGASCDMAQGPTCRFHSICHAGICVPAFAAVCE